MTDTAFTPTAEPRQFRLWARVDREGVPALISALAAVEPVGNVLEVIEPEYSADPLVARIEELLAEDEAGYVRDALWDLIENTDSPL